MAIENTLILPIGSTKKEVRDDIPAMLSEGEISEQRLLGSLAMAVWAYNQAVQILRVHDVAETKQALKIYKAIVDDDL